jgi:hypothetical protein
MKPSSGISRVRGGVTPSSSCMRGGAGVSVST